MGKIIFYSADKQKTGCLAQLAERKGYLFASADDTCLEMTLADLFETMDMHSGDAAAYEEEYLMFDGLSREEVYSFSEEIGKYCGEFEGIKCIRTAYNETWPLKYLFHEIYHEHQTARKAMVLDQMLRAAGTVDFAAMKKEEADALKQAYMDGFVLLQSGVYTDEQITSAVRKIAEALRNTAKPVN